MDRDYGAQEAPRAVNQLQYAGTLGGPVAPQPPMTRARYLELVELANQTVEFLEQKGLKLGEQCEFNNIATKLWFSPKGAF